MYSETAEILSINPPNPPILGDFLQLGDTPQIPGRKYPAPLFERYYSLSWHSS
jgi:hypothetical protein